MSPVSSTGATGGGSGPPSRRTSFSSTGRASTPGGRSGSSSRSTSFNLPSEAREVIRLDGRQPGDEVEFEEEMDEESACSSPPSPIPDGFASLFSVRHSAYRCVFHSFVRSVCAPNNRVLLWWMQSGRCARFARLRTRALQLPASTRRSYAPGDGTTRTRPRR